MDQNIIGCQDVEPTINCTTRLYIEALLEDCKCLPFSIRLTDKVIVWLTFPSVQGIIFRNVSVTLKKKSIVQKRSRLTKKAVQNIALVLLLQAFLTPIRMIICRLDSCLQMKQIATNIIKN